MTALLVALAGLLVAVTLLEFSERILGDPVPALPPESQQVIARLNAVRARSSCPALSVDASLTTMAQEQAKDMVERGFLSSVNPDDQDAMFRAHRFGYSGNVTESFASGLATPSEVATQWTNSQNPLAVPVTRRILNCDMISAGIGHDPGTALPAVGAHVWVLVLGDR